MAAPEVAGEIEGCTLSLLRDVQATARRTEEEIYDLERELLLIASDVGSKHTKQRILDVKYELSQLRQTQLDVFDSIMLFVNDRQ